MSQSVQTIISEYIAASAVISMVNSKLIAPKFPRIGAAISAICAVSPGDLAKLIADVQSIFPGGTAALAAKRVKANKDLSKIGDR